MYIIRKIPDWGGTVITVGLVVGRVGGFGEDVGLVVQCPGVNLISSIAISPWYDEPRTPSKMTYGKVKEHLFFRERQKK